MHLGSTCTELNLKPLRLVHFKTDQILFRKVLHNPEHVLHKLLQSVSASTHNVGALEELKIKKSTEGVNFTPTSRRHPFCAANQILHVG